jgi:hypothetical protein
MRIAILALALAIGMSPLLFAAADASAHQRRAGGRYTGIAIAEISHGEMIMVSDYRDRIIGLASSATDTDEPFRRVLNYAQIQYAYCLWGKVPGAVTDETSPFNECSHAYLAATKAVLLLMREMPHEKVAAGEIVSSIDAGMVQRGLALITCAFSGEAFSTADVVRPHWSDVPTHPVSIASLTAMSALLAFGLFVLRPVTGTTAPLPGPEDRTG